MTTTWKGFLLLAAPVPVKWGGRGKVIRRYAIVSVVVVATSDCGGEH